MNPPIDIDREIERLENPIANEIDAKCETAIGLGSGLQIGKITLPPPCMGVVLLLDLVDSPFVNSSQDCTIQQVMAAIYVIFKREKAADFVYGITRSEKAIASTAEIASQSDAHYAQYLKALEINSQRWIEFDKQVAEFSNTVGSFDLHSAVLALREYLNTCFAIFGHMPNKETDGKKKDMTSNG